MAFLPTVALFLAVAVAEESVPEEKEVTEVSEEEVEETADEEEADEEVEATGSFAECAKNTTWAEEDAAMGYTLSAKDTCNDVHPKDCLAHPDIAMCCPDECNKEKICSGFESAEGADLVTCLNDLRFRGSSKFWAFDSLNPSYWGLFDWKASDGECPALLADPEAANKRAEINLCCNASSTARRLAEAEADEADEADEAEADEAKMGTGYPVSKGEKLADRMCNGASSTSTDSASTATEETKGESTDGTDTTTNSASTFGFTALALMLVTA